MKAPRYPVTGRASVIECPIHSCSVALDESGRIASQCPQCRDEVEAAERSFHRCEPRV